MTKDHADARSEGTEGLPLLIELANTDVFGAMKVCGTCGGLKGALTPGPDEHVQLCDCATKSERAGTQRWEKHDFNQDFELCYCCAASEISSGSRFSRFFCKPCGRRVRAFNELAGSVVIPQGRHSLMNRVIGPGTPDSPALGIFVDRLIGLFSLVTTLQAYGHENALEVLARCGYAAGEDVPLGDYLDRARRCAPSPSEAFEALVDWVVERHEVAS